MKTKQEGLSEAPSSPDFDCTDQSRCYNTRLADLSQHADDKTEQLNVTNCSKQSQVTFSNRFVMSSHKLVYV